MAFNNAQDNEFDPEMERILQEHFEAEAADLQSPVDPWRWLESRMEEPGSSSFFTRLLGGLKPLQGFPVSPAFAGAAVAVVAVAVVATVWAVSGNGDPGSSGGMASLPPADAPASTARPTAIAMGRAQATEAASATQLTDQFQRPPARPQFPLRLPCRNEPPPLRLRCKRPWRNPIQSCSNLRQFQHPPRTPPRCRWHRPRRHQLWLPRRPTLTLGHRGPRRAQQDRSDPLAQRALPQTPRSATTSGSPLWQHRRTTSRPSAWTPTGRPSSWR